MQNRSEYKYIDIQMNKNGRHFARIANLHTQAYIELTNRHNRLSNEHINTLEIDSIQVDDKGTLEESKRWISEFIDCFETIALKQHRTVYIGGVDNPVVRIILEERGYSKIPTRAGSSDNDYWM